MDRNQAIGLVLIFAILFGYFTFFAPKPEPPKEASKAQTTQQAKAEEAKREPAEPTLAKGFAADSTPFTPEVLTLENADLLLKISTRGGVIEQAQLKHYKTYGGQPLNVLTGKDSHLHWVLGGAKGRLELESLPFKARTEGKSLILEAVRPDGTGATLRYALPETGYLLTAEAALVGDKANSANLAWKQDLLNTEKDFTQSRAAATTDYLTVDEDFDKLSETSTDPQDEKPEANLRWVSHKTKFFLSSIINRGAGFEKAQLKMVTPVEDSTVLKTLETSVAWAPADLAAGTAKADFYLGPNDYKLLQAVAPDFERNVYLGWPVIRWVNKYIVINVFHFLQKGISNYGIIIFLLVLFIRALLLPLGYKSYISMAKMRVLKPEMDEIKARVGDDMQAQQQEQMKLYNQVGINPLSGCIPLLLQMPILLAMFNFFPNSIELRQEHLWWAEDLSAWDSIATLPFSLPGYGSHVSLFTILMTISTLAVTYVNASAATAPGPMQSLQYVMPVVFMFILNSLPAGLSFYYLVSNLVSMGQQFLIKRFVNDDAIRARLEQNKTKNVNKKPGKFASRLQDALRQAEEAKKAAQDQPRKKK